MTTATTVAALNTGRENASDQASATGTARRADSEHGPAEDVDPAALGSARAGPGRFAHALPRAKQAKQAKQELRAPPPLLPNLTAAGRTVLVEDIGRSCTRLADREHDGAPLASDDSTGAPARRATSALPDGRGHNRSRCAPTQPAPATATAGPPLPYPAAQQPRNPARSSGRFAATERRTTIERRNIRYYGVSFETRRNAGIT